MILEISVMRKALSFQNKFGACKKRYRIHYTLEILSHVKRMTKRGYCSLCLTEKLCLLHYFDNMDLLNKKSELISKCRHETELLISSIK